GPKGDPWKVAEHRRKCGALDWTARDVDLLALALHRRSDLDRVAQPPGPAAPDGERRQSPRPGVRRVESPGMAKKACQRRLASVHVGKRPEQAGGQTTGVARDDAMDAQQQIG